VAILPSPASTKILPRQGWLPARNSRVATARAPSRETNTSESRAPASRSRAARSRSTARVPPRAQRSRTRARPSGEATWRV